MTRVGGMAREPAEVLVEVTVRAAVFNGGTVAQLAAAVTAAGGSSVWTQDARGIWRNYVVGAPPFVNAGFNAAFPNGFVGVTAVVVVK